jgi:hypothetical protein
MLKTLPATVAIIACTCVLHGQNPSEQSANSKFVALSGGTTTGLYFALVRKPDLRADAFAGMTEEQRFRPTDTILPTNGGVWSDVSPENDGTRN